MPNSAYAHHDRITLSGITAVGFHGVLDFEKRDGQPFTVDATLYTDFADAAAGDDLEKTTNYAQVAELIHQKIVFDCRGDSLRVRAHRCGGGEGLQAAGPHHRSLRERGGERVPRAYSRVPAGRHARYRREVLTMPLRPLSAHRAVLALGSNLGESESTIERAVVDLREAGVRILRVSPLYRTAPVGGPEGQPDYVNAVIEVSTELSPYELLKLCNTVEAAHHRERLVRWGPRTLDIDVIDYEGTVSDDPVLTLPHPRAHERAFVLTPWARMDPEARLLVARSDGGAVTYVPVSVAELSRDLNLTHEDAGEDAIRYMREMNLSVGP